MKYPADLIRVTATCGTAEELDKFLDTLRLTPLFIEKQQINKSRTGVTRMYLFVKTQRPLRTRAKES